MKWLKDDVVAGADDGTSDIAEKADEGSVDSDAVEDETSDVVRSADDKATDASEGTKRVFDGSESSDDANLDVVAAADGGTSDIAEKADEGSVDSDAAEPSEEASAQKSGGVWKKVAGVAGVAMSATREASEKVIDAAGDAGAAVVSSAGSAVSGAGSAVVSASEFVADVSIEAGKKVAGVAGGAVSATREAGKEVVDVAAAAGSAAVEGAAVAVSATRGAGEKVIDAAGDAGAAVVIGAGSAVSGAGSAVVSASEFVVEKSSDAWEKVGDTAEAAALRAQTMSEFAKIKAVEAGRVLSETSRELIEELRQIGDRLRDDPQELASAVALSSKAKIVDLSAGAATGTVTLGKHASKRLTEMSIYLAEASRQGFAHVQRVSDMTTANAFVSSAVSAFEAVKGAFPEFHELSASMRYKMGVAGLRGDWRPVDVRTQFYESSIPLPVRNLGEDAVQVFLKDKHASHIESVANAPGKAMDTANVVWEHGRDNIARGAANMTPFELAQVNAKNLLHAAGIVGMEALENAVKAGCVGMALEGVVSLGENMIYVYKGQKTREEALKSVGKDMLKKGAVSAVGGFGISLAVALGAGPALAAAAPTLVTIGGSLFVISTYKRIKTAVDSDGLPEEQPEGLAETSDGVAEIRLPASKQLEPGSDSAEEQAPEQAQAV